MEFGPNLCVLNGYMQCNTAPLCQVCILHLEGNN